MAEKCLTDPWYMPEISVRNAWNKAFDIAETKWLLCEQKRENFLIFMTHSNSLPKWTTFVKKVFDSMISLESFKMNAFWLNDSLTFTFYDTLSNSIPKLTTSVKKVFDLMISLESDKITAFECLTFTFRRHSEIAFKTEQLLKKKVLIWWLVYKVTKWLFFDHMTA